MARTILSINSVLNEIKNERKRKDDSENTITVNNSEYDRIDFRQI